MLITIYTENNKKLADYNPSTRNSTNLDSTQEFQSISTDIIPFCLHKSSSDFFLIFIIFHEKTARICISIVTNTLFY